MVDLHGDGQGVRPLEERRPMIGPIAKRAVDRVSTPLASRK